MAKTLMYVTGSPTSVKIGDTDTDLYLQVAKDNEVVDLTSAKSITVKIADANKSYLKDITVSPSSLPSGDKGILVVPLNADNIGGLNSGDYYFEVWIVTADNETEIYPDMNVTKFHVFNNIVGGTTVFTTLTLQQFADNITDMEADLQSKVNSGYFKGGKGTDGKDGVGISSTVVSYQLSTSGSTAPTGTWSSTVLSPTTASPYLWVQTVITYSDGSTKTLYTISVKGDKGDKGDTGSVDNTGLTNAPAFQTLQTQVNNSAVGTNLVKDSEAEISGKAYIFHYYQLASLTALTPGQTYTMSFSAKFDDKAVNCQQNIFIDIYNASWSFSTTASSNISTDYQRVTHTFTIPQDQTGVSNISVFMNHPFINGNRDPSADQSDVAGTGYIKEFKLEKGSVATHWCPNPTEILTQADYAKIKAAIVALGGSLS